MDIVSEVSPLPEQPQVYDISQAGLSEGQDATAPSGISTMQELQKLAPPLYKAIMESIAYRICTEQNRANERIKKILDQAGQSKK